MTIATLLDRCEVLDNELEAGSGEDDEARAITALNMAQDHFEAMAATYPKVLGTTANVTTTASTETTAYPTGFRRLDDLWLLDASTSRPKRRLDPIADTGRHIPGVSWPWQATVAVGTGEPVAYWTNDLNIYWQPLPDAVHTVRCYGFKKASDFTARTDTFAYADELSSPFAAFAARCMSLGVADEASELQALADELFRPILVQMRKSQRQAPQGRVYARVHVT